VGRTLQHRGREFQTVRIIGVAQPTLHYGLDALHDVALYRPIETLGPNDAATFALRLADSPDVGFQARVREAIWTVEPSLPVPSIEPLSAWIDDSVGSRRLASDLAAVFSFLALVLAAAGLYGTLLYSVNQRRRELGIRMALGADRGEVQRMVLGQGIGVALAGLLIGVAGALASGRALSGFLFGVSPYDPMLLLVAGIVMLLVALVASFAPARRATAVDPVTVLNSQ
jgi:hypothetical protein